MKPRVQFEIQIGSQKLRLGIRSIIMGILNVTPDSFSDGGLYLDARRAVQHAVEMVRQGADWIDVGGESTRPGSAPVSQEEELRRVLPVIRGVRHRMPRMPISIDTTKAAVAAEALRAGAKIVNDVSGLRFDPGIAEVARRYRAPLILAHLRGRPTTMQRRPFAGSIWRSVSRGLGWSIRRALSLGVKRSQLIIDPGLGFGKNQAQNFEILRQLSQLHKFHLPILVGASRKSFIQSAVAGTPLNLSHRGPGYWVLTGSVGKAGNRRRPPSMPSSLTPRPSAPQPASPLDFGDAAASVAAVLGGAHIVRVHYVPGIVSALRVADRILSLSGRC